MVEECIFCKIIKKQTPAGIIYEDETLVAFPDINPHAPVHILIVPKKHLATLNQAEKSDQSLLGQMLLIAKKIAADQGITEPGYKLAINVGRGGGQLIDHLHLHLLGGAKLKGIV